MKEQIKEELEALKKMPLQEETVFGPEVEKEHIDMDKKMLHIFQIPYSSVVRFTVNDKFLIVEYKE